MKRHLLIALVGAMLAFVGTTAFAEDYMSNTGQAAEDSGNASQLDEIQLGQPNSKYTRQDTFHAMDNNGDGQISESEFDAFYVGTDSFDMWDENGNGSISKQEFGDGLFGFYDLDDDGFIDNPEWGQGVKIDDYTGADSSIDNFTIIDLNTDKQIDPKEFDSYYWHSNIFGVFDTNGDGKITEGEFGQSLYGDYDDNGDGHIDQAEWKTGIADSDYGDNETWEK